MDFDSILKNSLAAVNDNYQAALGDLREIVDLVSAAVNRNAGERYGVGLIELANDIKGATFRVYFDTNAKNSRAKLIDIFYVRIPVAGYPIKRGRFDRLTKGFSTEAEIESKEELNRLFALLLQNPESPLIQAIGYAMRSDVEDEDSPF